MFEDHEADVPSGVDFHDAAAAAVHQGATFELRRAMWGVGEIKLDFRRYKCRMERGQWARSSAQPGDHVPFKRDREAVEEGLALPKMRATSPDSHDLGMIVVPNEPSGLVEVEGLTTTMSG
jgi:hypothetical protein